MKILAILFLTFVVVGHAITHHHKSVEIYSADRYHNSASGQPQHDFQLGSEQL